MRIVKQKNPKWERQEKVRMENPPKKAKKRKKKLSDHTPLPLDPPLKCQDTPYRERHRKSAKKAGKKGKKGKISFLKSVRPHPSCSETRPQSIRPRPFLAKTRPTETDKVRMEKPPKKVRPHPSYLRPAP